MDLSEIIGFVAALKQTDPMMRALCFMTTTTCASQIPKTPRRTLGVTARMRRSNQGGRKDKTLCKTSPAHYATRSASWSSSSLSQSRFLHLAAQLVTLIRTVSNTDDAGDVFLPELLTMRESVQNALSVALICRIVPSVR